MKIGLYEIVIFPTYVGVSLYIIVPAVMDGNIPHVCGGEPNFFA